MQDTIKTRLAVALKETDMQVAYRTAEKGKCTITVRKIGAESFYTYVTLGADRPDTVSGYPVLHKTLEAVENYIALIDAEYIRNTPDWKPYHSARFIAAVEESAQLRVMNNRLLQALDGLFQAVQESLPVDDPSNYPAVVLPSELEEIRRNAWTAYTVLDGLGARNLADRLVWNPAEPEPEPTPEEIQADAILKQKTGDSVMSVLFPDGAEPVPSPLKVRVIAIPRAAVRIPVHFQDEPADGADLDSIFQAARAIFGGIKKPNA